MMTVSVRVQPGASREAVTLLADDSLLVRVRARAVQGQANARLIEVLADALHLRRRDVEIVSGETARQKRVRLALDSADDLRKALAPAHPPANPVDAAGA